MPKARGRGIRAPLMPAFHLSAAAIPIIAACTLALVAGGVVKGLISIGLPLVGLPLLMLSVDVQTAVNLLAVPILLSNLVQAVEGTDTWAIFRRFLPIQVPLAIGTYLGTALLATLDQRVLLLAVGCFTVAFGTLGLLQPKLAISRTTERWLGPPVGFAAGLIGGMSTLFGPVLTLFMVGLGLPPNVFVKAISILYTTAGAFLMISGAAHGTSSGGAMLISALGIVPVYCGMLIGQRARNRLNAGRFRFLVLLVVVITGVNMIRTGLGFTL
jgi:uncharacterized protein